MKILVVDDTYFMRELICESLQEQGFKELTQASNGEEALNALSNKHYDLIVTDWNMPKINGVELIKKMKLNPALRHTKIIMLTGDTTPEKILEMKELGVNGYISKPFTPELLTDLVIKLS